MRVRTKLGYFMGTKEELRKLSALVIHEGYMEGKEHDDPFTTKLFLDDLTTINAAVSCTEEVEGMTRNYNDIHVDMRAFWRI